MKKSKSLKVGLGEALQLLKECIVPLSVENLPLIEAADRTLGNNIYSKVDSPSVDASLKDGYAVISRDIEKASPENPLKLDLIGTVHAGEDLSFAVGSGTTVRILTGAEIPQASEAVVSEEFTRREGTEIFVMNNAEPGRNILFRGSDIKKDGLIAGKGTRITPGLLGLLAAAGHSLLPVVRKPVVAIIATGDEVVAPGVPLPRGKLYASNITTLAGYCFRFGFDVELEVVKDDPASIESAIERFHQKTDAVITSGGAWTGDHDLVAKVLLQMGGERIFHRIRIGPGKATGLLMLHGKPVFVLPGGPPSNLMGFLQIALPGLFRMAGREYLSLASTPVRLVEELRTKFPDWTQYIYGKIQAESLGEPPIFLPIQEKSRLRSMAEAEAIVAIPEGKTVLTKGEIVSAQLL